MEVWSFLLDLFHAIAAAWRFIRQPTARTGLGAAGAGLQFACTWVV